MSVIDINQMRQDRAKLIADARALLDQHDGALPSDVVDQYEKIEDEIGGLNKRIAVEERQRGLESGIAGSSAVIETPGADDDDLESKPVASPEYRAAVMKMIRRGKAEMRPDELEMLREVRAQTIGVDSEGGYLTHEEFNNQLQVCLREENVMRQTSTVITTTGTHNVRVANDNGTAGYEAELATTTESDTVFDNVVLGAFKLATIVKVSEELLEDSDFNLESFLAQEFASRFGRKEEEKFTVGTGSGEPNGLVTRVDAVGDEEPAGAAAAIDEDDLLNLFHAVKRVYRNANGAGWIMNDTTIKLIRAIKDQDGQFIWQPGLQAGQPDRIFARPVFANDFVPDVATTNISVLFGDLSKFWIGDRGGMVFQRMDERFRDAGQIGFRGYKRNDSNLIPCGGIFGLKHP